MMPVFSVAIKRAAIKKCPNPSIGAEFQGGGILFIISKHVNEARDH